MGDIVFPIAVEFGQRAAHQREAPGAWVYRMLERQQSAGALVLTGITEHHAAVKERGMPMRIPLPSTRIAALSAWAAAQQATAQGQHHPPSASLAIIAAPAKAYFLLQRKDDLHPHPACRGRFALLGGAAIAGEDSVSCLLRELYEEIRDVRIADEIAALARPLAKLQLPMVDASGAFSASVFTITAPTDQHFTKWERAMTRGAGLSEGTAEVLAGDELAGCIAQEHRDPGSAFMASQHRLLELVLFP